jgi:hypothetical protein
MDILLREDVKDSGLHQRAIAQHPNLNDCISIKPSLISRPQFQYLPSVEILPAAREKKQGGLLEYGLVGL